MSFLNPSILYLLSLTIIPVIIHLINLRKYRTLYFSSLFFLRSTIEQTRKTKNLFDILILIARILTISAIVIAFAQPTFSDHDVPNSESVNLIIDNTLSMQAENSNGNFFEQARQKAYELVNEVNNTIPINVHTLTQGVVGKNLTKDQALQVIGDLQIQHGLVSINQIIRTAESSEKSGRYIIISDFQSNTLYPDTLLQDSLIDVNAVLLAGKTANISIDTLWFDAPAQWLNTPVNVFASIRNHSQGLIKELPVRTYVNHELYAAGTVSIEPQSSVVFESSIDIRNTGIQKIYIETDDLPISFDNRYYSGIFISHKVTIIEIGERPSPYLKALLNDSSYIDHVFVTPGRVTPSAIKNAEAIVINGIESLSEGIVATIKTEVNQGLNLIVTPGTIDNLTFFNELLNSLEMPMFNQILTDTSTISQADVNHPLLKNALEEFNKNMNLPTISRNFAAQLKKNWMPVLYNGYGNPLLLHRKTQAGNIYLFGFNVLEQNFALNPIFVPVMYNAITITDNNALPHISCSKNTTLPIPFGEISGEKPPVIKGRNKEFIPYVFMQQNNYMVTIKENQIETPGYYEVSYDEIPVITIAANHNRNESVSEFLSVDVLTNKYFSQHNLTFFTQGQTADEILSSVKHLWRIFVAMALVFILIELWLLKIKYKRDMGRAVKE